MDINLIIVVILVALAILDLTVGVANDAINFLNSALGAKAGSFKTLLIVAALGVLVGVLFSSGMMEVARKGIFDPSYFLMPELLIIFVAVMYQDILLLDFFNTLGLPTSTTVSIVFGLFGSASAISIIKIIGNDQSLSLLNQYINTGSLLKIISAIGLSIVIAFIVGAIIQYLTRLIFTFNYSKTFRRYGSLWSGLAVTALSLFILLKGAKGATFIPPETSDWIKNNIPLLSLYLFIGWSIIVQLLMWFTKIDILRMIVFIGTFALAMAFAANDLVNFIGAPLAGLNAYQFASEAANPLTASMEVLNQPVKAPTFILLGAGAIMVLTLFLNRKARNVANTTIGLGRQDEGIEKFDSNALARGIVRMVIQIGAFFGSIIPQNVKDYINKRFDLDNYAPLVDKKGEPQAFDMLRAAVILMVAAGLISLATSLKLPLSTTYVTFIVAMAAALPDKSWGRETAVYRVSGVVTVIGGWFMTALIASIVAGVIALGIYYGGLPILILLLALVAFTMYRTSRFNKTREEKEQEQLQKMIRKAKNSEELKKLICYDISEYLKVVSNIINETISNSVKVNLTGLRKANQLAKDNFSKASSIVKSIFKMLKFKSEEVIEADSSYVNSVQIIQDSAERIKNLAKINYRYFDNNHNEFTDEQISEFKEATSKFNSLCETTRIALEANNTKAFEEIKVHGSEVRQFIYSCREAQLKRIKSSSTKMKRSTHYLHFMSELDFITQNVIDLTAICLE